MALRFSLLVAVCFSAVVAWTPPAWVRKSPQGRAAKRALAGAKKHVDCAVAQVGQATADLFEWEHERAARHERFFEATSYWDDPRIHNFGNVGWRGWLHAAVAPAATHSAPPALAHAARHTIDPSRAWPQ
jgi:hypothetical protein